jgi:hypothetical protein
MKLTGENRSTWRKPCPSATLSTTNPTWTEPGSNPGLRDRRPATNRLSHGTANIHYICVLFTAFVGCYRDYINVLYIHNILLHISASHVVIFKDIKHKD